jgi:hypothetical protein
VSEREIKKGYANDAIIKAIVGSGLNSKKSVLEKGKEREEIIPDADSQTGITAKINKYFKTGSELLNFKYREIPIIPPILHKNIPIIKVK